MACTNNPGQKEPEHMPCSSMKRSHPMKDKLSREEEIAQLFHSTYEKLAPLYEYETHPETKTSWDRLPSKNKSLMIATVREILPQIKAMLQPVSKEKKAKIICLCGSTRFTEFMMIYQWELTKKGFIVVSWCALPDSYFQGDDKAHIGDQEGVKEIVDEVHMRKIDLADEVHILNIGGYIGESTQNELNYAKEQGKIIKFIEPQKESADER